MTLNAPDPGLIAALQQVTGPKGWLQPETSPGYLTEPRGKFQGRAALILRPDATGQVSQIVRLCALARVGIVPWGGGTGLVGGQTATEGPPPILLSLDRMTRIREANAADNALIAEAGCTLEDVQNAASEINRLFPLSYASQGSARIGGALAVNSGGVQVLRYGNARDLCLGLEAVLPDGSVHHGLKLLRKDNTGFDLRHLLIGCEGTLGVITAAALKLFAKPHETATAMVAVRSPAVAIELLRRLQDQLGDVVTAFELISQTSIDFLQEAGFTARDPGMGDPLPEPSPWRALVEIGGLDARSRLEAALGGAMEAELVMDGVLAESEAQRIALWKRREAIPEANRVIGAIASHDISTPISALAAFIDAGKIAIAKINPELRINCFGHIGDGNLHYNIFPPKGRSAAEHRACAPQVTRTIHDLIHRFDGSFSAEHGVGRLKREELTRYGDPAKLAAMHAIKAALDPGGIMNPGAVLTAGETL